MQFGYALSSEEHTPNDLVHNARRAEETGFQFLSISDHYHPWIETQGHAPFVWNVLGGIAAVTERIAVMTGVVCPTVRIHPAVIAQAAATTAAMMPGRFWLGLGSGEALNEHITGEPWPPATLRIDMLAEAVQVIRMLFDGDEVSFWGDHFTVENARLFTLPDPLPPIYLAAGGQESAYIAGEISDGLITTSPDGEVVQTFQESGGEGLPVIGKVTLCYAEKYEDALETAHRIWPTSGLPGALKADLPTPDHFEQAVKLVTREQIAEKLSLGPDPAPVLELVEKYRDAGFTHLYFHQIGPDQEGFFRFYQRELQPKLKA
jgi:G6PDH family F420-dependent oxidoreductase